MVDANKIGDRILQLLASRAAFPAEVKMRSKELLIVRRELSLKVPEQLLVGKM
jgi:hypothetical protein